MLNGAMPRHLMSLFEMSEKQKDKNEVETKETVIIVSIVKCEYVLCIYYIYVVHMYLWCILWFNNWIFDKVYMQNKHLFTSNGCHGWYTGYYIYIYIYYIQYI